jgi:ubiquinone/menaquinone biosynthesis methyltransferase
MNGAPIPELRERAHHEVDHGDGVRAMFDRIAPTYDVLNRVLSAGTDRQWRARAIHELRGAPPGPRLDLCAGTMDLTALLADAFPDDRVVAADFAKEMLDAGRHKAPRAEVVVADAMDLPFADNEFSGVICGFGMRNLADPARGAREARRVLKPGGVFVTLEFFRPTRVAMRLFHGAYARVVLPAVGGLLSGERSAYRYLARSMDGFLSRDEYVRALADAGFVRVTATDLTLGVASVVRAEVSS